MIKYKQFQSFWDDYHKIGYKICNTIIKGSEVYYKVNIVTRFNYYRITLSQKRMEDIERLCISYCDTATTECRSGNANITTKIKREGDSV